MVFSDEFSRVKTPFCSPKNKRSWRTCFVKYGYWTLCRFRSEKDMSCLVYTQVWSKAILIVLGLQTSIRTWIIAWNSLLNREITGFSEFILCLIWSSFQVKLKHISYNLRLYITHNRYYSWRDQNYTWSHAVQRLCGYQ